MAWVIAGARLRRMCDVGAGARSAGSVEGRRSKRSATWQHNEGDVPWHVARYAPINGRVGSAPRGIGGSPRWRPCSPVPGALHVEYARGPSIRLGCTPSLKRVEVSLPVRAGPICGRSYGFAVGVDIGSWPTPGKSKVACGAPSVMRPSPRGGSRGGIQHERSGAAENARVDPSFYKGFSRYLLYWRGPTRCAILAPERA